MLYSLKMKIFVKFNIIILDITRFGFSAYVLHILRSVSLCFHYSSTCITCWDIMFCAAGHNRMGRSGEFYI